jgi:hypothetical protein
MKRALAQAAGLVAAVALVALWLHFIHDPGVRRRAQLAAQDAVADSITTVLRDSLDAVLGRAAGDSARAVADSVEQARLAAEADSLRALVPGAEGETDAAVAGIPDTAVQRLVTEAVARERWIAGQAAWTDSVRIARLTAMTDTLRTDLAARAQLLLLARAAVDSLESQRDQWRKEAHRGRWGLGISLGPAVGPAGFDPVTVQVGLQYRLR